MALLDKVYNETVKAVTEQIESMKFDSHCSKLMAFVNAANKGRQTCVDYAKGLSTHCSICAFTWRSESRKQSQQPQSQSLTP